MCSLISEAFNICVKYSYFPNSFKCAKVIPILKKGKENKLASSYRPISLLSCLGKILEKILVKRINEFTEENNVINKEQYGFRKEHSTIHQAKRLVNIIQENKLKRRSTGIVLLDIEKAFDSVWHQGLLFKMHNFGYPQYIIQLIKSFLKDRSFQVFLKDEYSSIRQIPAGLSQGPVVTNCFLNIYLRF